MPKYYIGQKVIKKDEEKWRTVADIEYCETELVAHDDKPEYGYCYTLDSGETAFWYELTHPPAKLEFGYCAVGDVIEHETPTLPYASIVKTREIVGVGNGFFVAIDSGGSFYHMLYQKAKNDGWKIKEKESIKEELDKILEDDPQEETITLNGKTYKLVE